MKGFRPRNRALLVITSPPFVGSKIYKLFQVNFSYQKLNCFIVYSYNLQNWNNLQLVYEMVRNEKIDKILYCRNQGPSMERFDLQKLPYIMNLKK